MAEDDGHTGSEPRPSTPRLDNHQESHTPDHTGDSTGPPVPRDENPRLSPSPSQASRHPDSSLIETTTFEPHGEQHLDSFTDEQGLHAHLSDVESSFLPPISPIPVATRPEEAIDDTFVFDASPTKPPRPPQTLPPVLEPDMTADFSGAEDLQQGDAPDLSGQSSQAKPAMRDSTATGHEDADQDGLLAPLPIYEEDTDHSGLDQLSALPTRRAGNIHPTPSKGDSSNIDTTATVETLSSSPTAAAAARTISKSISMATIVPSENETGNLEPTEEDSALDGSDTVSREDEDNSRPQASKRYSSDYEVNRQSTDVGTTPGHALKTGKSPRFLRSRNGSQRSSTSSFPGGDDLENELTTGFDGDLLPSASSVPLRGPMPRSTSNALSRTISLGSMASGIDDYPDNGRGEHLEPPLEEDEVTHHDILATPRANKLVPPTDTALARKVRNIQVPDSIAREYKSKGGFTTPFRTSRNASDATPSIPGTVTRGGKNLTLKEQSSTIERLSKENFDLKLKVMFLSDRLDKLSPEGVKETMSENVELKTSLGIMQRDNKVLRRRVKELEKRLKDDQNRPSTARSGYSSDAGTAGANDEQAREREEELIYLRERVEEYVTEIEHLRNESMANQAEKRKLAETVKSYRGYSGDHAHEHVNKDEEVEIWKDLFEQETVRREQVDEDNRKLRDDLNRLQQGAPRSSAPSGLSHTTNIYNITRKGRPVSPSRSRPDTGHSAEYEGTNSFSQADTMIEDYRRENDQLRHEIGELRREVGAQTSMLTSRNREKERLYQEIEDLKLSQRRGGQASSTVDSLLDRSASRSGARERAGSRNSGHTRMTVTEEDPAREELENKLAESRDKINELKLLNQELQRETQASLEDMETLQADAMQLKQECDALQDERDAMEQDILVMQSERDEALQEYSTLDYDFNALQKEAQDTLGELEDQTEQQAAEIERLQLEVQERADNFAALQEEMRGLSEALAGLEDDHENKLKSIQRLESELNEANRDLEDLEAKLVETNDKVQRLGVQQESSQDEIAFLREEQEGDKIRIGDLEASLAAVEQELRDEHDRAKELDQRLAKERRQRELVADREKEEVQQLVNELNKEASTAKDEVRKLRKSLSSREVEATEWKERLMELENNLREALGDLNGTRSSLLKSIAKLQRELENTVRELDTTKAAGVEKERMIKQRDGQLESHGLEVRKLGEMLEKERQAHRNTKNHYETFQRTHSHVSRTVTSQDSRISELEGSRNAEKKRFAQLEAQFKDQLAERNNLLLVLWTRLSSICGSDWAHNNSLISGRALPSTESIGTMLPGFSKNILGAIKMIETIVNNFHTRVKSIERELWKEYQSLESTLDAKSKKLERLEFAVRSGVASGGFDAQNKLTQLETAYRALKIENATLQRAHDARTRGGSYYGKPASNDGSEDHRETGSPSPAIPTGPTRRSESVTPRSRIPQLDPNGSSGRRSSSRPGSMTRSVTMGANEMERLGTATSGLPNGGSGGNGGGSGGTGGGDNDVRWMFRLRELEGKLKQEREARNMDRAAARQRIQDSERQNGELSAELNRARRKAGTMSD
ncbi:golgin subfamily B member 1 [Microdochium nivale]|nr:golgin subfamily B member 1 [Microdochium nivale]